MKRFLIALFLVGAFACTPEQEKPENLAVQIDALIEKDMYVDALNTLEGLETSEEVSMLKEKVHLNYGMHLEYYSNLSMSERMNGALRQFATVLRINPDNEKAHSEIEQILGVYATFSDRSPEEDVIKELRELGFEIN